MAMPPVFPRQRGDRRDLSELEARPGREAAWIRMHGRGGFFSAGEVVVLEEPM